MQRMFHKLYNVYWTIFVVLFLLLFALFHLDIYTKNVKNGYEVITDYDVYTQVDKAAPAGVRQLYLFKLKGVEEAYCHLMVYTIHQEMSVYQSDVCIYRMSADETAVSGESPGCLWNEVSFATFDNGGRIRIEITPMYESSIDIVPTFYLGSKADLVSDIVLKNLPVMMFSLVTIVIGFIYIGFILYNYKKSDTERNLMMLGHFAIQVGLWKLTDSEVITLLLPGYPVLSQVPFMALMLMCMSFTLYIKELYSTREHKLWSALVIYSLCNMTISLLLQYIGIADFRQTLILTHINIVLIVLLATAMTIYEVRVKGWNHKLRTSILCMGLVFIGAGVDMLIYYMFHGQIASVVGTLTFMVYIFVMGLGSIREIKNLMDIGIKAQQYEKMAYHDQLTGLFNRSAFADHTGDLEFTAEKSIIIVMDLNNLKACNDKLGHDKGDIYIKESARLIRECFEDIGRCYRMGGDEFHVLMTNGDLHLCKQRLQVLKERVAQSNAIEGFQMGIACGYKMYDRLLDYDIHETARRADKVMYQEKFAMKEL